MRSPAASRLSGSLALAARRLLGSLALAAVGGCAIGPDYQRPTVATAAAYKELDGWKPAEPRNAASSTAWWSIYDDPLLDQLERTVEVSNQNLIEAQAAYRYAQALVAEARAGYFPSLALDASAQRQRQQLGTLAGGQAGAAFGNQFSLSASASWAPDVWGKIRRTVEANVAGAQASAADLAAARLSAQATLATDYFQLRASDALRHVLEQTVVAYKDTLDITQNQYEAGTVAQTDVITAETELEGAQAQLINVGIQRAQLEHAIAVLCGKVPAVFSIDIAQMPHAVPVTPSGVPSTLLERRPDIAAAERQVAAANAQIGVALAAYYPDLTLSASAGFAASALSNLLQAANRVWAVGPQVSEQLFDGGLRKAQVAAARAQYDESVATYRQTVLSAFQQVEDQLAALRILEEQARVAELAVRSAREAVRLTLNQYQAGTVAYTSVVTAQTIALADEQSVLTILGNRLAASVALVQAPGGGWDASQAVAQVPP